MGSVGLEVYGDVGLLRSLAVSRHRRARGVGDQLVRELLNRARTREIRVVYLLTTTAERYFPRFGFQPIGRGDADPRLESSEEFRGACPDTAVCMRLRIEDG